MSPFKKISTDPAFWSLIIMNLLFVQYFREQPNTFKTYVWLYWLQSVMIGIFNFFTLAIANGFTEKDPITGKRGGNLFLSFFFLFHYGTFHLVYMVFIATGHDFQGKLDFTIFKYGAGMILINQLINFIQSRIREKEHPTSIGASFILPYLRIIPMHLTILLPAWLHISSVSLFIILKTFADVIMHLVTTRWYWSTEKKIIGDVAKTDLL